jgi:hypothetical protein
LSDRRGQILWVGEREVIVLQFLVDIELVELVIDRIVGLLGD